MRIFFSAGEPSGDQHAAHLIQELRSRRGDFQAEGFGGPEMQQQGCRLLFELTQLAVMGFLRVIPLLARFRRLVKQAEAYFQTSPPDAVVLVDFPGFNWWIARAAKRCGIPVYYYLPPQLWAWAPWRIRRVRNWVDHVICALPFEYEWYRARGIKTTWVGHPFFDEVRSRDLDQQLLQHLQNRGGSHQPGPVIALLPGSRNHEVERNWPVMLQVAHQVSQAVPNVRFVTGNYRPEHTVTCRRLQDEAGLPESLDVQYVAGRTSEVIEAADCCLMVSGSVSLELLARRKPGVVLYRWSRLTIFVANLIKTCRYITLTNLIANAEVMPEFLSHGDPTKDVQQMSQHLIHWCTDRQELQRKVQELTELADSAAQTGATERTAALLEQELTGHRDLKTAAAAA